ncbi:hypothetical protein [Aeromonas hydrophila]|uniref:hypothetical protein n=1 Tax=Aeromonas hydrophila TaxID=644 RepID=UPI000760B26B|nr:hypothetical protein [Aeromonas hydrophila]EIM1708988.1 hypothetical protein [Aeromonas dhakensis]EIS3744297.1 hypothetical protein [Aeromonas hydrophila]KWR67695.1 hypothetical protein ATO50_00505 [Aeromonas hydrophila]MDX7778324.1 hypothetical protein [Aeromonas hydrophila]HAU4930554.1 hypothetical protein [Aeromonas hydrophila]
MMHYYAQHTATRDWYAPVLTIEEVERTREAGIPIFMALYQIMESGFDPVAKQAADVVGAALTRAARYTTTGRGRNR